MNALSYLVGYYGMCNTGDDALLLASAWGAQTFLAHKRFIVNSPRKIQLPGLPLMPATLSANQRIKGENRLRNYSNALRSDTVIFGGGSVLHNSHDISIKRHIIKLSASKKALALGVGIGPFKNKAAEKSCAKFLNECQFVGLRDQQSLNIANSIAPEANCKLTFDLAPLLTLNNHYRPKPTKRKGIAVCLCPNERLNGNINAELKRMKALTEALTRIYVETGRKITLIDFNGQNGDLGDKKVHEHLQWNLTDLLIEEHLHYQQNPLQVLERLSGYELVIGMRLHAAILAYLAETPVISLNYHTKCEGWCEQIGVHDNYIFDSNNIDPDRLSQAALEILSGQHIAPKLPSTDATDYALNNWRYQNVSESNENLSGYSTLQQVQKYFINLGNRNRSSGPAA